MSRARILLADGHKEMRDTIAHLLEAEFEIVASVANGEELLAAELETKPDLCVCDISMPHLSGIHAAQRLKARHSQARVIFLTTHDDGDLLQAALETDALGYVLKSRMVTDLDQAIRSALRGEIFISPSHNLGTSS